MMKTSLLDTRGMIIRALTAGKDPEAVLDAETGTPVNSAAYGTANFISTFLLPLLEEFNPLQIVAVWDVGHSKYRTALYPDYKGSRKRAKSKEPKEAKVQRDLCIRYCKNILTRLGIMSVHCENVEADDVIAKLCTVFPGTVLVDTVDQDLLQLQADHENVTVRRAGEIITDGFNKELPIEYTTLSKSILGDQSDGYGGVKGVGQVAWDNMMQAFGDDGMKELEEIVKNGDRATMAEVVEGTKGTDVAGPIAKMYEQFSDWQMMYALAQLHPELCEGYYNGQMNQLIWTARLPQRAKLREGLEAAGCGHYLPQLQKWTNSTTLVTAANYDEAMAHFSQHAMDGPAVAFDLESFDTLNHEPYREAKSGFVDMAHQQITGWSVCYGTNFQHTMYVSCGHRDTDNVPMERLNDMLAVADKAGLIIQNATFETVVTSNNIDYDIVDPYDTAVMSSYVDENQFSDLKSMSNERLRYKQITYDEVLEAAGASNMAELTGEEVLQYGADDAYTTARLFWLYARIMWTEGTIDFYAKYELGTYRSFLQAYIYGVPVDFERMATIKAADQVKIQEADASIRSQLLSHCGEFMLQADGSPVTDEEGKPVPRYNAGHVAELVDDLMILEAAKIDEKVRAGEFTEEAGEGKKAAKRSALEADFVALAPYQPYSRTMQVPEFIPSAKQLSELATKYKLSPIEKVSISAMNTWVTQEHERLVSLEDAERQEIDAELASVGDPEDLENVPLSQELQDARSVLDLIAAAVHQFKARAGAEYAALKDFVETVAFADKAKEKISGSELNASSPKQMQALFYVTLGLPIQVRSKPSYGSSRDRMGLPGAPATDAKAIDTAIAEYDGIPDHAWKIAILKELKEQRRLLTRSQLFFTPYPLWENPDEPGLVNPQFKNCGTVTRRPSGGSPNFLQISKKDPDVRQLILAPEGYVCVSPDYNGQELRIMGSESEDPVFLDAYCGPERKDIHSVTASGIAYAMAARQHPEMLEKLRFDGGLMTYEDFMAARFSADEEVAAFADKVRKAAKQVNFLIIYGGGPAALSRNIGVPEQVARAFMDAFFLRYPNVTPWQNRSIAFAQRHGYARTAYGNRRHLPDILDPNRGAAARAERQAVNFPIQGGAADILKVMLYHLRESQLLENTGSFLVAPVYDEVFFFVPKEEVVPFWQELKPIMDITPPGHRIPMDAELSIGAHNWGDMIELGGNPSVEAIEAACDGRTLEQAA